ncbi:YncE family protein [Microbulbifer aggregans]|uniref:YncE family protein n=1 Tax=Microbulbifer aggregans TaxID=1769779 RepID=UPI001CFD521A|nr:hypothetical protein [Microbulbifer aggregans]
MKNYKYHYRLAFWLFSLFLVACGGGSGSGSEQQEDLTPDKFSFSSVTGAELDTWVASEPVLISGIDSSVNISVDSGEYSINGGDFTTEVGRISEGDSLILRLLSSEYYSSMVTAEVNVEGVRATFSVETKQEQVPPEISIDFPDQKNYLTYSEKVVVIGRASDNDAVAGISVNGIEASSDDGFQTWQAILPVDEPGNIRINAVALDNSGNSIRAESQVIAKSIHDPLNCRRGVYAGVSDTLYFIDWPYIKSWNLTSEEIGYKDFDFSFYAQVIDDVNNRIFGVDNQGDLYSVNPDGSNLFLVSPEGDSGIVFADSAFSELVLDVKTGMLYGIANTNIISIDVQTGKRTVFSGSEQWGGDGVPYGELEMGDGELYFMDTGIAPTGVYRVDIASGTPTLISEPGSATIWDNGFVVDETNRIGYFIQRGDIVKLDLTSGSRSVLSPASDWIANNYLVTTFSSPNMAGRVNFDSLRNRLIVQSCASDDIFSIDAASGDRIKLTSDRRGSGADLTMVESLVYSATSDSLFAATGTKLLEIDQKTGDRKVTKIEGLTQSARGLVANAAGDKIYAYNDYRIIEISPFESTSHVVTNTRVGEGATIGWAHGIAVDELRNRILVVDYLENAVIAVSLETGEKTVLSSANEDPEGWLLKPTAIAVDLESDRIFVIAENRFLEIDPVSGEITKLLEQNSDEGYSISGISRIVMDPKANRVLASGNSDGFMQMDIETGEFSFAGLTGGRESISNFTVDTSTGLIYGAGSRLLVIDPALEAHFVLSH